jgi:LPXTG-site transpeptidase (sortase) family protein
MPIIWTKANKDMLSDLLKGAVHYPGTALPGQTGTSYISAHSSNYPWVKSKYRDAFARLGAVKKGDSFMVTVTDPLGKPIKLHYVVDEIGIFKADDQRQFANTSNSVVALSTCWPVGTTANRLVLNGNLSQVER